MARRVLIMGAAGRDFHNFNVLYRNNPEYRVVAFTATQIPDIEGRLYPSTLAGEGYPAGIPIYPETDLVHLIEQHQVDEVVFSYSDVRYDYVMDKAAQVNAAGANFTLISAQQTMLASKKPVVAVCAVRTGVGKSQTTRHICDILRQQGHRVVVVRHPMPYGDLGKQAVQRFATYSDLDLHQTTIEEREEYEPHIDRGIIVYAGVDYEAILRQAEQEADVIIWDGGNNDTSFYQADLYITLLDPHRPGHELSYYPGGTNVRLADVVVINKVDTAAKSAVERVRQNAERINPTAKVVLTASPITVEDPELIKGKSVLVVEDGPTLTHGEMRYGAGVVVARQLGAQLVDPRPYAVGSIAETFRKYDHLADLLPAMGYGEQQVRDLEDTIRRVPCDAVLVATPIDLRRVLTIEQPSTRARYELAEQGEATLPTMLSQYVR
ncbi:MAG: cyclic 2,3-diphosphoglycerate synthase [Bacillota bacterium]|jgi:predicted GTPase